MVLLFCDKLQATSFNENEFLKQVIEGIRDEVFVLKELVDDFSRSGFVTCLKSILNDDAIDYNKPNGKVILTGKTIYQKRNSYIQVKVEDTGKLIEQEEINNIFY